MALDLDRTLVMILAGGRGSRLEPLTSIRAKPAVTFGGKYRIIDFVLSNFVNSGIYKIKVLTQFKSNSLNKHLYDAWYMNRTCGHYIDPVPAQMATGEVWYQGTADAIYQNLNLVYDENPARMCVFGGDHIYKMDVRQKIACHCEKGADLTISAIPVPIEKADQFGVIEVDTNWRIIGWEEKPSQPKSLPNDPAHALVSMGNYIFETQPLIEVLEEDHEDSSSSHDFGKDIIPKMIQSHKVFAYDFSTNSVPGQQPREKGYWRDVGTIGAFYEANMDLRSIDPVFDLYNRQWPIRTANFHVPPAKFVFDWEWEMRRGVAYDSLISGGCIISGASVRNSILSPGVFIHSYTEILDSIVMHDVEIGRGARIRRAIIDKYVKIPEGETIGYDLDKDQERYFVSEEDIVVIAKVDPFERWHDPRYAHTFIE
ncbi:MAG: glucose-1-phosphate adenylyltransferase [Candidatus Hinthialibacteria bacterium]|nr:MAG: Glucose-1-phosphate adenylyltransferase [Candidatus Hinthialibacteria bacterium OLB16]MBV6483165.1 Glucose-1-phosphate adenylyltransferase [bacterium]